MNEPTQAAIASALGEEAVAAEAERGRKLSVDDAVDQAVAKLRA